MGCGGTGESQGEGQCERVPGQVAFQCKGRKICSVCGQACLRLCSIPAPTPPPPPPPPLHHCHRRRRLPVNQLNYCGTAGAAGSGDIYSPSSLLYTLGSITVPSLASVYNEFALKKHMDTSVLLQVCRTGCPTAVRGGHAWAGGRGREWEEQQWVQRGAGRASDSCLPRSRSPPGAPPAAELLPLLLRHVLQPAGPGIHHGHRHHAPRHHAARLPGGECARGGGGSGCSSCLGGAGGGGEAGWRSAPTAARLPTPVVFSPPLPTAAPPPPHTHRRCRSALPQVTCLLVVNNALQGILSSFFYKYADTILKKYSSTIATIFTGACHACLQVCVRACVWVCVGRWGGGSSAVAPALGRMGAGERCAAGRAGGGEPAPHTPPAALPAPARNTCPCRLLASAGVMSAALFGHTLTLNFCIGVSVVFVSMHQFFSLGECLLPGGC